MNRIRKSSITINPESRELLNIHAKSMINRESLKQDQLTSHARAILMKIPDTRTSIENKVLNKFSKRSPFFSAIAENSAPDVAQNILRNSHIYQIGKNRIIANKGSQLQNIIVLLSGKFGILGSPDQQKDEPQKQQAQIYKKIIQNSLKIARDLKRRIKQVPLDPIQAQEFKTTKAAMFDITIKRYIQDQEQVFNLNALVNGKKYTESIVTCKNSFILSVSSKIFFDCLASYVKKVKSDKISAFRKFQYFNNIQSQRLIQIVDELPLVTIKKNQFIYKQGQQMKQIYLLIKGSIKLTKTVDLFRENPNNFYVSRQKLGQKKKLPFADFSEVYNYKPRTKLLEIGISNQISIFGEEEFFSDNCLRRVNAQVSSQVAVLYVISLAKLEENFQDKKDFISELKQGLYKNQTKKKILYRQQKLSQLLICETKNNMDYFYIQQNQQSPRPSSPRKYKIQKINSHISPSKSQRSSPISHAAYNTFNFDQFPLNLSTRTPLQRKKNKSFALPDENQIKILQLVHTVSNYIKKEQPEKEFSNQKRKGRRLFGKQSKIEINIHNPLFGIDYLNKTKKQQSRIGKGSKVRVSKTTQKSKIRPASTRMSVSGGIL